MRGTWSSLICNGYGSEVTKVCYDKEKELRETRVNHR